LRLESTLETIEAACDCLNRTAAIARQIGDKQCADAAEQRARRALEMRNRLVLLLSEALGHSSATEPIAVAPGSGGRQ
jgi:hypothetical protein